MQDGHFPSLLESQSLPSSEDLPVSPGCGPRNEATELRAVGEDLKAANLESVDCAICTHPQRVRDQSMLSALTQALKIDHYYLWF